MYINHSGCGNTKKITWSDLTTKINNIDIDISHIRGMELSEQVKDLAIAELLEQRKKVKAQMHEFVDEV